MLQQLNNPLETCELKFSDDGSGEFSGYGSVFGSLDTKLDTILEGAYAEAIAAGMPKMFVNHAHLMIPPGDWVEAKEDSIGLLLRGVIDLKHHLGPSLHSAMKRGAMDGLSIGFNVPKGGSKKVDGARVIKKIDLVEVSVVTFPADSAARITSVKAEINEIDSIRDAELFLRDSGVFSRSMATAFVSHVKAIAQRDSVPAEEIAELKDRAALDHASDQLINFIQKLG